MICSEISLSKLVLLASLLTAFAAAADSGLELPPGEVRAVVDRGLIYLRSAQASDGSFGTRQPRLQTALGMLAMVSAGPPGGESVATLNAAAGFLVSGSGRNGDLSDDEFSTESQALAFVALLSATPYLTDAELLAGIPQVLTRSLRLLQRWQDRSSSSSARGGWKMDGGKGRENDRRATAWALLAYETAQLYGLEVPTANRERGLAFLLGSFKAQAEREDQIGGLSVDADGLTVASISAMGGWFLQRQRPHSSEAEKNLKWLIAHPASWTGPNYFYANFFRLRAQRLAGETPAYQREVRRVFHHLQDHQAASGAVGLPPGNAQNTVAMGPVFATAMAVLIINHGNSRLVFDEDHRAPPLW